jgi:hypothetical protein
MIDMGVGEDQHIDVEQVDLHLGGIFEKKIGTAGIEKDLQPIDFDIVGYTGFALKIAVDEGIVVNQHGKFQMGTSWLEPDAGRIRYYSKKPI